MPRSTATHTHTRTDSLQLDVWNLVLRCWLWDYSGWELRCVSFMTRSLFTVSLCIRIPPRSPSICSRSVTMKTRKLSRVERLWKVSVLKLLRDTCTSCLHFFNVCHVKHFSVFCLSNFAFNQPVIEHLKDIFKRNYKLFLCLTTCQSCLFIY